MREIIFIGQSGNEAVYYNTRTKEALVANKSALLDREGARRSNRAIIPLMLVFIFLGLIGGMVAIPAFSGFRYSSGMTQLFIAGFMFVFFGSMWMLEIALYKNVKYVRIATKQQFEKAVYSNLFWDNFSNKKATFLKIFAFMVVILLLLFATVITFIAFIPGIIDSFERKAPFELQIITSPLIGILPAVFYLSLFQNNPIRWLLAVRKYEQGKVIFAEDKEKKHE
ncbi:hypothetical protein D8798_02240 [Streptococcus cristatus]|uniref:Uncharacterized protein n=1 Tax=Streptococcus cristatus TaxID=45634 RepID=A0A3R9KTR2_STRCR|nr:hypothetical protein [Streptococcus cristatus]RSJ77984.1 hypothetical protein D8798_02240 [Streptococcus cristatus]